MIYYMLLFIFMLLLTIVNIQAMPKLKRYELDSKTPQPLISILIPMRNEERNVKRIISSIKGLTYSNLECVILDDQSTDQTRTQLLKEIHGDPRFTIIEGKELREGWVGKVHACHQLSQAANGDYLLFVDADVELKERTLEHTLATAQATKAALLTGFPRFPVKTWLEALVVPLQHVVVFSYLPVVVANRNKMSKASAAHGAFMFIKKEAYEAVGGHEAVKSSLVEDVHLAQLFKQKKHRVILANITSHVSCYMYETTEEVWNGFAKNIFVGLGRSAKAVWVLSVFFACYYVLPLPFFIAGIFTGNMLWILPFCIMLFQRFLIDRSAQQKGLLFCTMPASAIVLMLLMNHSMKRERKKQGYEWKGRHYQ
ncbi:cellulose synthase/poly-beta-1,6-N-acetylglucosamine synthase-like glycosyltransferase [Bacillus sp. BK006]|nr:cellulose synthase/poly-beta-1,6-N-acetylglucosamine synthase-like glycosyltransferase [Bacillus sp. BK006]